jgi:hypothetical protein
MATYRNVPTNDTAPVVTPCAFGHDKATGLHVTVFARDTRTGETWASLTLTPDEARSLAQRLCDAAIDADLYAKAIS